MPKNRGTGPFRMNQDTTLKNSNHSLHDKHRRGLKKNKKNRTNSFRKQNQSIRNLFQKLRNSSISSANINNDNITSKKPHYITYNTDQPTTSPNAEQSTSSSSKIINSEKTTSSNFRTYYADGKVLNPSNIINISDDSIENVEAAGSKRKLFFEDRTGEETLKEKVRKIDNKDSAIVLSDNEDEVLISVTKPCLSKNVLFSPVNPISPQMKLANSSKSLNVHSSTPISKRSDQFKSLQELNISKVLNKSPTTNNMPSSINLNKDVVNLTKQINHKDYLTIDLTGVSKNATKKSNSIINLVDTLESGECSRSVNSSNRSMSGESDVTVMNMTQYRKKKDDQTDLQKIAGEAIAKMNTSAKGKLFDMITKELLKGCEFPRRVSSTIISKEAQSRATETAEDTYIKEVILGHKVSRNSVGSNIYNPNKDGNRQGLRMVVIDGSNVAMEHGQHKFFSVKGLNICIDYFVRRGHVVKAFVPRFRCKYGKSSDPRLLDHLERRGLVVYTPSREVQGKMICPYDDRYIVQCAAEFDGVIVSGDNYRDLMQENAKWKRVIETRLLQFTWVNDMIMFPRDPLGRDGPTLEAFLKH